MKFSIYQESKIGGRKVNQDRMGYCFTRESLLMVLADGMGGHSHGEIAAQIALQTIANLFQHVANPMVQYPEKFLQDSFFLAHNEIMRYKTNKRMPDAPRTTLVLCLVQNGAAYWAHAGDSRLYWMRNGQILTRTKDHSTVENLLDQGKITAAQRATHPDRNKIYNCIGAPSLPLVQLAPPALLRSGDSLMLCSDGLWGPLDERLMAAQLHKNHVVNAIPGLVSLALNLAGGQGDNVTALAMRWEDDALDDLNTVQTDGLGEDSFLSTVLGPFEAGEAENEDLFDDSQIENAIAEIRKAINRSART